MTSHALDRRVAACLGVAWNEQWDAPATNPFRGRFQVCAHSRPLCGLCLSSVLYNVFEDGFKKGYQTALTPLTEGGTRYHRLLEVVAAAQQVGREFIEMQEEQRQKLIIGQTLESASENWNALEKSVDFAPLLAALAALDSPTGGTT